MYWVDVKILVIFSSKKLNLFMSEFCSMNICQKQLEYAVEWNDRVMNSD